MSGRIGGVSLKTGLMLSVCILSSPALAQSLAIEDEQLETIFVTASRTEQSLNDVTRSVALVEQEQIEQAGTSNVADILKDIPGLNTQESSTPGLKRISIRGEGNIRNVIMVDGQEITDHSSYGPMFLIDPAMIERIEVVKGPSAVLHGAKAIGGVVNIITKKGGDKPFQASIGGGYDSSTGGYDSHASFYGGNGAWDYRITATKSDHGDRDTPGGKLSETANTNGSSYSSQGISGTVGYTHDNHSFRLVAEHIEKGSEGHSGPRTTKFKLDLPVRDRTKGAFFYDGTDLTDVIKKVHVDGYVQRIDRQFDVAFSFGPMNKDNQSVDEQTAYGLNGQVDLALLDDHLTIAGLQFLSDSVDRRDTVKSSFPPPFGATNIYNKEANLTTISAFVQDEWSVSDNLTLTAGMRYFHIESEMSKSDQPNLSPNSGSDDAVVGALGLSYTGFDNLSIRANLSQGYVYPTLVQAALGSSVSPAGLIDPNSDLKPEKSLSAEIGFRYDNGIAMLDVAAFHSTAEDYITSAACPTCAAGTGATRKYVNINKATTYGVEISGSYRFADWGLTPYADLTLMQREFTHNTVSTKNTDTPALAGRAGIRKEWNIFENFTGMSDLYVRGSTSRKQYSDFSKTTSKLPSFATLNLSNSFVYDLDEDRNFRLTASIENILDHSYVPSFDENLRAPGRTFKISSQLNF